jgi:FkbM family methyltransferase
MAHLQFLDDVYLWLFRRPQCRHINERIHSLALRSLGVLNWENSHVSGESAFIRRLEQTSQTQKEVIVFDVGGHHGEYAGTVLEAIPRARLYSFEPNPLSFEQLCKCTDSKQFHPTNVAVSDHEGYATLYDHRGPNGTGHASLVRGVIEDIHGGIAQSYEVKQITLDSFLASTGIQTVDLLKIDVEGNEANVLRGCPTALRDGRIRIIQFEFNEMNITSRVFFQDFVDLLRGYKLFRLLPQGMIPLSFGRYAHFQQEVFAFQNIVAILSDSPYDCAAMTGAK